MPLLEIGSYYADFYFFDSSVEDGFKWLNKHWKMLFILRTMFC